MGDEHKTYVNADIGVFKTIEQVAIESLLGAMLDHIAGLQYRVEFLEREVEQLKAQFATPPANGDSAK